MTVPWTITRETDTPLLKVGGDVDRSVVEEIPRIPISNTDVLERRQINGFNERNPYFSEGVPVAIKYEVTGELQYKSGYIIGSTGKDSDGLRSARLYPTHGNGRPLYGKQGTKYRSALILSRPSIGDEVRGGAEMMLAPIKSEYIVEEVLNGTENLVSQTI